MSVPSNILDSSGSSTHTHVLVAFRNSQEAATFNFAKFDPTSIGLGQSIPNAGNNVVVVNEFVDTRFSISEAMWDFDFIPNIGVSTTASTGKIVVADRVVGYGFLNHLRNDVLNKITDEPWSLSHLTFVLTTFFFKDTDDGTEPVEVVVRTNPFFFYLDTIESVPSNGGVTPTHHILNAISVSNTLGQLKSFSSLYQMNITHKDGNLHNEIPSGTGSGGILSRKEENRKFIDARKQRLNKSKPMRTLKDIFEAFQTDLNNQKFVHQAQLQQWVRELRSEGNTDKIAVAPQQNKPPTPKELPIDFEIDLDSSYDGYAVDNRNMPFEQPDIRQGLVGIRSFPVKPGATIVEMIERIMMLSTRVGDDAALVPRKAYKICISAILTSSNRYRIVIKIRRYTLPSNSSDLDTGPGAGDPIHFYINDPEERDTDIISFKSILSYEVGDSMLESPNAENSQAKIIYADREQPMAERRPDLSFFTTLYSGIRPMIEPYSINGLENAKSAGNIKNMVDPYTYIQTSEYELVIRGNPTILSDFNRNPVDIVNGDAGNVFNYPRPEFEPAYVRLTIFQKSQALNDESNIPEKFYYDGFYHLVRVVNMFGVIKGQRSFYQKLYLRRTDDLV